jgi:hypothetical protein
MTLLVGIVCIIEEHSLLYWNPYNELIGSATSPTSCMEISQFIGLVHNISNLTGSD